MECFTPTFFKNLEFVKEIFPIKAFLLLKNILIFFKNLHLIYLDDFYEELRLDAHEILRQKSVSNS